MTRRGFTWHEGDDDVGLVNAKGRIYDPKIARFLQTDPIISNPLDAQTHNPYSYVRLIGRSCLPIRADTTPKQSAYWNTAAVILGISRPVKRTWCTDTQKTWLMVWPRESGTAPPSAADHAPSAPEKVGPSIPTPAEQIMVGMGDRAIELGPELAIGFLYGFVGVPGSGGATAKPGSATLDDAGTRAIDRLNELNPIYAGAMDVVQGAEAQEKGDYVGVGRAGMGFITTVVMTAITLKAGGGRKVPNPNGKKGGTAHQAKVAEVAADVKERGLKFVKEHKIKTPKGEKESRFVDVAGFIGDDLVEMHQIGKQTMGERPVSREVKAMNDIEAAQGARPIFHPYNK
jgi:RHS repeat-associated protein